MPEPVIIKVGADLSELTAKLDSLQSQFDEFKGAAKQSGEAVKQAFTGQAVSATKDLSKSMDGVKMSAKQLDDEIRAVNESIKKTNDPKAIAALKEYRQELIAEEAQLGKTTQKFESMRGKIMAIKNELFKLRAEGKQGTQRFQELTVELARLGNIKDDINELGKALSSDTRHIDGMIQGVQGLVGAFSIFQGVQMLVGSENKEFQQAMTKMMATMQVLNGVQQVANILQKESAFMQTAMAAATKMETLLMMKSTAATVADTVATNANTAAKTASKGVIGLVIVAVAALAYGIYKLSKETAQQAEDARIGAENWEAYRQGLRNIETQAAATQDKMSKLADAFDKLGNKTLTNQVKSFTPFIKTWDAVNVMINATQQSIKDVALEIMPLIANFDKLDKKAITTMVLKLSDLQDSLTGTDEKTLLIKKSIDDAISGLSEQVAVIDDLNKKTLKQKNITQERVPLIEKVKKAGSEVVELILLQLKLEKEYNEELERINFNYENGFSSIEQYNKALNDLNITYGKTSDIIGKIDLSGFMKDWENQFAKQDTFFQSFVQEGDTWNRERTKQVIDGTMSLYNQLNDILLKNEAQKNDQLIKGIDDKYAKDKEKLDEDLKNKKLSQEQYNKEAVELEKKKEQQISKIKREQWEKEKKAAIAKATINTLVGTTQALAEGGIAGIITGALVLAAGIAEVASIASQKNPYRKGTAQILSGNSHEGGGISLGQFGTAEGGEMLGILSKNKTKKFGKPMMDLFDGINKGNDSKMLKGLSGLVVSAMPEIKQGNQVVNVPKQPELSKMLQIMERPQETVTIIGNKKIIKQGNYTRIVHL